MRWSESESRDRARKVLSQEAVVLDFKLVRPLLNQASCPGTNTQGIV